MFLTHRGYNNSIYVDKNNAGDVEGILNLKFEPQDSPAPIGSAGLWESTTGDLYFNGTNLSAGGGGGGTLTGPVIQDLFTIPSWDYTYNALRNGAVDIDTVGSIGPTRPVLSMSMKPGASFVSSKTIWCDSTNGDALSYDAKNVVVFDKAKASSAGEVVISSGSGSNEVEGSGYIMPKLSVKENLFISNFFSNLDPGAMLNTVALGVSLANHCVTSDPLTWSESNVLIGVQVGSGLGALANNYGANVMIGNNIGAADGNFNILIGGNNMISGNPGTADLSDNIAIGNGAGIQLQSGSNILIGRQAGYGISTIGSTGNIIIGKSAASTASYSQNNILIGENAGNNTTSAGFGSNVGIGGACFGSATTAVGNVAIGVNTARFLTTGARNVMLGIDTGFQLTTGSRNIIIGNTLGSGSGLVDGDDNILINTILTDPSTTRTISIGVGGTHTSCFIQGIYGVPIAGPTAYVFVNTAGQLGTSSLMPEAMKAEIKDLSESFINKSLDSNVAPLELDVNTLKSDVAMLRDEIEMLKKRCEALNATNVALFKRLTGGASTTSTGCI